MIKAASSPIDILSLTSKKHIVNFAPLNKESLWIDDDNVNDIEWSLKDQMHVTKASRYYKLRWKDYYGQHT